LRSKKEVIGETWTIFQENTDSQYKSGAEDESGEKWETGLASGGRISLL